MSTQEDRELAAGYRPFDETLEKPRTRVLRALCHFEWVSADDLSVALDIGPGRWPPWTNAHSAHLSRLVRERKVVRRGSPMDFWYRITERGRRELAATLGRCLITEAMAVA